MLLLLLVVVVVMVFLLSLEAALVASTRSFRPPLHVHACVRECARATKLATTPRRFVLAELKAIVQ